MFGVQGCEIMWKKGKNITVKTIKKKQKHKSRGSVRTVTKSVQADSFFNFFSPPLMPEDPNSTLASDIQVRYIKIIFMSSGNWNETLLLKIGGVFKNLQPQAENELNYILNYFYTST